MKKLAVENINKLEVRKCCKRKQIIKKFRLNLCPSCRNTQYTDSVILKAQVQFP